VSLSGDEPISTNFWLFGRGIFPALEAGLIRFLDEVRSAPPDRQPEFLIPTVVNQAVAQGTVRVRGLPTDARFLGITHPADRDWVVEGLAEMTESGEYPSPLWGRG
jgi:hypothetical protein